MGTGDLPKQIGFSKPQLVKGKTMTNYVCMGDDRNELETGLYMIHKDARAEKKEVFDNTTCTNVEQLLRKVEDYGV